jgi:hypothetical protein
MIVEAFVVLALETPSQKIKSEAMSDFSRSNETKFVIRSEEQAELERERLFRRLLEEVQKSL